MSNHVACINMIKQQLRTNDVLDESILELFINIPRKTFVPQPLSHFAYTDMHIPLAHEQCMMTPLEEAKLLQALALKGHETILEVGTGSGFLTALLSRLCKKVISIDYYDEFTKQAKHNLAVHHCENVELITGDACQGWLDKAPYDVIIFTGAMESLNETHRLQILPGGKLFAIVGKKPVMQAQMHSLDHDGIWTEQLLFETVLPPLINKLKHNNFVF